VERPAQRPSDLFQKQRRKIKGSLEISCICLLLLLTGVFPQLACQQLLCVNDAIKAVHAKAAGQPVVPHLKVCPSSANRAMTEAGVRSSAD